MNVYWYTGFWGMKRHDGYVVNWSTTLFGTVRAVVVVTKSEDEFCSPGKVVVVNSEDLRIKA